MGHALIIECNMAISRGVKDRLMPLGFDSFYHSCTEPQAIEAARVRAPDLVVIGETAGGSGDALARAIVDEHGTSVVLIYDMSCALYRRVPEGVSISRPFLLSDIDAAIALSRTGDRLEMAA